MENENNKKIKRYKKKSKPYTKGEEEFIRIVVNTFSAKDISILMDKDVESIKSKIRNMHIVPRQRVNHGLSSSRLYHILHSVHNRCYNITDISYPFYGARGITVVDEWNFLSVGKIKAVENFTQWAHSNGYEQNLTLDRKNSEKDNYGPDTCRWVDQFVQQNNRRGRSKKPTDSSKYHGVFLLLAKGRKPRWVAQLVYYKKIHRIGTFDTEIDAAIAYNNYIINHKLPRALNEI